MCVEHDKYWRTARIKMKPLPVSPSIGMFVSADTSGAMIPVNAIEVDCSKERITLCGTITVDSDDHVDREIDACVEVGWHVGVSSRRGRRVS